MLLLITAEPERGRKHISSFLPDDKVPKLITAEPERGRKLHPGSGKSVSITAKVDYAEPERDGNAR